MGYYKDKQAEYYERHYGRSDKLICENCIGDFFLKDFIHINGSEKECDYCSSVAVCIELEDLMQEIMDGIWTEHALAVDELGWDGEEGGYVGAYSYDTYDLVYETLAPELKLDDANAERILDDIVAIMDQDIWCAVDPYGPDEDEGDENIFLWDSFSETVKWGMRYVFFRALDETPYYTVLDNVAELAVIFDLIETIPANYSFYRGRSHSAGKVFDKEIDFSSPPNNKAKANRMSAEGISVFYCGEDAYTAVQEIAVQGKAATYVAFHNLFDLHILDLTKIRAMCSISLFDKDNRKYRPVVKFLRSFSDDLMKDIDHLESIEYVPSQIVAEYFKFIFKDSKGNKIDGIKYWSAKNRDCDGICYVIFADQNACLSEINGKPNEDQIMKIDMTSLNTI